MVRTQSAAGACLWAMAVVSSAALAAGPVSARIRVLDDRGGPIAGAEVFAIVRGAFVSLGRTDPAGALRITGDGGEELVARTGLRSSPPARLTGTDVRITIPPATIGLVHARNDRTGEQTIGETSASAVAFDDVALARSLVPNYRSRAEGGSGHQTLNGVPLDLPSGPRGGTADDPGVPSELIDSFGTTQADDGTVTPNYHLLAPTAQPAFAFSHGLSAYDGSLWKGGMSGTAHGLGYALALVRGSDNGPLAGATLADASGERYDHSSNGRHTDVSLSLARTIGSTQINLAGFATRKTLADIDATQPGAILAGIGPGNTTVKTSAFGYIIATQTHGRDSYHALDSRFAGGSADDAQNAVTAGTAGGYTAGYRYSGSYDELAFTRGFGDAALTAKAALTQTAAVGYITAGSYADQSYSRAGQSTFTLDYERNSGGHGYGFEAGALDRFGAFAGTDLEARAHLKATIAGSVLQLSALHGPAQTQAAYSAGAYDFSAPSAAAVTCAAPSATVTGPSSSLAHHPEADTLDVRLQRDLPHNASISAGGFLTYGRNTLVVPASQLGGELAPAYRAQLTSDFAFLCPGERLAASDLYIARYESVPRSIAREWFVDGSLPLGPLRVELTYETYSSIATRLPSDLTGVASTLIAGSQLPGIPLHRANMLLSYRHGRLIAATALQYTAVNNVDALPGHVTVTAGAQLPLGSGRLAFSAQNLFHAFAGTNVSPRYAVPLATTAGALPALATPLRPVWSVRYTLPLGPTTSSHR